ncbi:hypothetical protein HZB00_00410 [Candidatus Woesearchaeota archaeon]|nr:hypothetical protein [Candidatus Woesearchaeota archaeon]
MTDQREQALQFIRTMGPVLPVQLSKALNTNILFASAILAELVSRKQVLMSSASIGGSKLYYLQGQEIKLCERVGTILKGKEKEAFEFLHEKKVVLEKELEPWQRVAFRDLKDLAVFLSVSFGDQTENFWKYRLVDDVEAKGLIEQLIEPAPAKKEEPKQEIPQPVKQNVEQRIEQKQIAKEELQEVVKSLREEIIKEMQPQFLQPKPKQVKEKIVEKGAGKFYEHVLDYLHKSNITVLQEEVVKKDKEFNFLVRIPSPFGELPYYVKGKDKKTLNETELLQIYSEGQLRKLPAILLTNGSLNKKAESLLQQKMHGQVIVKSLL